VRNWRGILLRIGQRRNQVAPQKRSQGIEQVAILGLTTLLTLCILSSCHKCRSTDVTPDKSVSLDTEKPLPEASKDSSASPPIPNDADAASKDSKQEERPRSDPVELEWLPDGARILVERRWLLQTDNGNFVPIACTFRGTSDNEDCEKAEKIFSPSGKRVLVFDRQRFAIGPPEGPLGPPVSIPHWVIADEIDLFNTVFWLSERTIFVQQSDRQVPDRLACRLFDVQKRKWEKPKHRCLSASYSLVAQVVAGPAQLLAVSSGAEGMGEIEFYRYNLEKGQSKTPILSIILTYSGSISFHFSENGSQIYIITSCRSLDTSPEGNLREPSEGCRDSIPWRLFSVSEKGPIVLRRSDLPPGSVLDPKHNRFAWPRENEICIGDPAGKFNCFSRPLKKRDTTE
jgi:hypothetical protein